MINAAEDVKTDLVDYVTFYLHDQYIGIPVDRVQEVIVEQAFTDMPKSADCVLGLLNLRGQIVTAIDLKKRLRIGDLSVVEDSSEEENREFMNIIVRDKGELFSLRVDSVGDVVSFSTNDSTEPPVTLSENWRECCTDVYRLKNKLLLILDIDEVLNI